MDVLLDKFQNDFIKKALWTAYINNKIGINWIDTNIKNNNDVMNIEMEDISKTKYIEEKYIKESIETFLSIYGGNIINLYEISIDSNILPFSSYISNYRIKSVNTAIGELLINQGKERREKMILENEEKKIKKILWSGYLTFTEVRNKRNICKIDIIPMIRQEKQTIFKSMDHFNKNLNYDFLSKGSNDISTFSTKRKTFSILNLIDINIIDSAWLYPKEFFCQLSNDLEEMNELLYSIFLFRTLKLLKLGLIVEFYIDQEINEDDDDMAILDNDPNDVESKKYYGILIPISEYLGFIRLLNDDATSIVQSYIKSSRTRKQKMNENFLSNLTEEDLYELLSIGINDNSQPINNKINNYDFSMTYLERWYKSILNNFNSSEVKKIELTELMLLSPNSENVLPDKSKEKEIMSKKNTTFNEKRKTSYTLFSQDSIIDIYKKREKEKELQNNDSSK
eukprot:jgi/Orpsp1_1/1184337/evm.model.c7180000089136.1